MAENLILTGVVSGQPIVLNGQAGVEQIVMTGSVAAKGDAGIQGIQGIQGLPGDATFLNVTWGAVTGSIASQTDLQSALGTKLTATNNLSDVANVAQSRINLGVQIGTDTEAFISATTSNDYFRGDKTFAPFNTAVRLNRLNELTPPSASVSMASQRLTTLADPTASQDAATKFYVDGVAQGLSVKGSVVAATTGALGANTYTAGVITASANAALVVDGVTVNNTDRILVKNEVAGANNGIYTVTDKGSAITPFVLTRSTDMNANNEVAGAFSFVIGGTANANTGWIVGTPGPFVIGTTSIPFTQFSSSSAPPATNLVAGIATLGADGGAATLASDAQKAPIASPTFTGTVTVPTPSNATDATTKTYVDLADSLKANSASPTFTGIVTVPTPTTNTSPTTKDYVDRRTTTSVKDYGAVGDGVTDDTAAISSAMDAANTANATLYFPSGTYVCGAISKTYAPHIIAAEGTVTIKTTNTSGWTWLFSGSIGLSVSLSSNLVTGSKVVAVNTTGLSAGDIVLIGDSQLPFPYNSTRYQGQTAQIGTIDSVSQLTLIEGSYTNFLTASSAFLQKVTPIGGATIRGLKFLNTNATSTNGFLRFVYARNTRVDFDGVGAGASGVRLEHCYNLDVKTRAYDYYDNSITGLAQYGYGAEVVGASTNGALEVIATRVRHAVSGGGIDTQYGEPVNMRITGVANGCTGQSWDWHAQGRSIVFANCLSFGSRSYGFSLRGRNQSIVGGLSEGDYGGVWVFDNPNEVRIDGLKIRNVQNTDYLDVTGKGGNAILVANPTFGVTITNVEIVNVPLGGIAVKGGAHSDMVIKGNQIRNIGMATVAGEKNGIRFFSPMTRTRIMNNLIEDNQIVKTTLSAFQFDGTNVDITMDGNLVENGITEINASGTGLTTVTRSKSSGVNTGDQTNITGNAGTVTTNANLTGDVTSVGNATTLASTTVAPGSYTATNLTVDAKGRITAAANGTTGTTPDATTLAKGVVQLAGDLGGTAALPTVPGLTTKEPTITTGTTAQYFRGDKTMQTLNQDVVPSGTTNKAYTATEQTKLAGIATAATANSTDAVLLARANHTGVQAESTVTNLVTDLAAKAPTANPTFTGTVTVPATINATDAAQKQYVDSVATGLDVKASVRLASNNNHTLATPGTVDSVTLVTGDRVLLKNQTTASENGIYAFNGTALVRATDADTSPEVTSGMFTFVSEGTINSGKGFVLSTADPITLGTTGLTFAQFSTAGAGVTSVSVASANGLAGTVATATTTPAITLSTTVTGLVKGNGTALSAAVVGTDYAPSTAANATGIVKSTITTGALTTAIAADFPTLNQNTTGTAGTITGAITESQVTNLVTDLAAKASLTGIETLTNKTLTTPKADFIMDTLGGKEVELTATAASANWLKLTNTVTGSGLTVGVAGTGANESINLAPLGTGIVKVNGVQAVDISTAQNLTNKNLAGAGNTFPTLNQSTTGTAANVTGTVAIANGGTGATTAYGARNNLGDSNPIPDVAYTIDPRLCVTTGNLFVANRGYYYRAMGLAKGISTLKLGVAVASGNISVAVYPGNGSTGSAARPSGTRKASTGAIACPAAGIQTVTLDTTIDINEGDWFFISADNTTATFARGTLATMVTDGYCHHQTTAHPAPATVGTLVTSSNLSFIATA